MNQTDILDQLLCQLIKSRDTSEYTFFTVFVLFVFYISKFLIKYTRKNDRKGVKHDPAVQDSIIG
jgi:hypothetical protein